MKCLGCGGENGIHSYGCSHVALPSNYFYYTYPTQGWICPRCQKANAPWIQACDCPAPQVAVVPAAPPTPILVAWPQVMDLLRRVLDAAKQTELPIEKGE